MGSSHAQRGVEFILSLSKDRTTRRGGTWPIRFTTLLAGNERSAGELRPRGSPFETPPVGGSSG